MLTLFKKKKIETWVAYLSGTLLPIQDVPDEIFSTKMMGDGIAILTDTTTLCAPSDGTITLLAPTRHAIAIQSAKELQILLHIGLDSACLPEHCFEVLVKLGDKVEKGQPLIKIASSYLKTIGKLYVPMVIVENPNNVSFNFQNSQKVIQGESEILQYEY